MGQLLYLLSMNISVLSLQHQFVFMEIVIAGEAAGRLLFEVRKLKHVMNKFKFFSTFLPSKNYFKMLI